MTIYSHDSHKQTNGEVNGEAVPKATDIPLVDVIEAIQTYVDLHGECD
jgi:hypothetical protein